MTDGDWLGTWGYPLLLAILSPTSAIIATIITNYYASKRSQKELKARVYESLLAERRESLSRISETMTDCYYALNEINNLRALRRPNQREYDGVREKLSLFEDSIRKSVWLDEELSKSLAEARGIAMRFLEAAYTQSYLKSGEWEAFMTTYSNVKNRLKEALGVPKVEEYLRVLYKY
jgi:hypothetical protein